MASLAICVLLLLILAMSERGIRLARAFAAYLAIAGCLLLPVGDAERALLLAALVVVLVISASRIKLHHSGYKLQVADVALVRGGTLGFLVTQYRRTALAAGAGLAMLAAAATAVLAFGGGESLDVGQRLALCAASAAGCLLAHRTSREAPLHATLRQRSGFFSTFAASVFEVLRAPRRGALTFIDIAPERPLPLSPATQGQTDAKPDILVIQHESVFDPRLFGLPVEPHVADFLSPPDGRSGTLAVDIYGGGSWQSEFSLLTGLSSASFGRDAYFIQKRGAGRFRHTLPHALARLGYRTMMASSCRRRFLHYDIFYAAAGFRERLFSDDLPPPFDVDRFEAEFSDRDFLGAVLDTHAARVAGDRAPHFVYALTNCNHGPHDRCRVPMDRSSEARRFAAAALPDPGYGEYYARLAETAATWRTLKRRLAAEGRPMLVVHYGDHQPVLTRSIESRLGLADDECRRFRTFYALEAINFTLATPPICTRPVLDIAFLGTAALAAAGLPLDAISATRATLVDECGEAYFAAPSERKRRFHRALVDLGMIEL